MRASSEQIAIRSRPDAVVVGKQRRPRSIALDPMFCLAVGSAAAGVLVVAILAVRGMAAIAELDHTTGLLLDFEIYWAEARELIRGGGQLHDGWLYSPFAALVVLPFGALELGPAKVLFWCMQGALTLGLVRLCYTQLSGLSPLVRWVSASGLVLHSLPVLHCLKWGQLSLLVVALTIVALPKPGWSSALLLAVAASIKVYAAAYTALYIARADARALLRFVVAAVLLGVIAPFALLGPHICAAMWFRCLAAAVGLGQLSGVSSQSLSALVHKLFELRGDGLWRAGAPGWPPTVLAAAVSGGFIAITWMRVHARRSEPVSDEDVMAIVLTATLVANPAWVHYFVMLPVAQAILIRRSRDDRAALWLCAVSILVSAIASILAMTSRVGFFSVQRYGLVTVATAACLIGLWRVSPVGRPGKSLVAAIAAAERCSHSC